MDCEKREAIATYHKTVKTADGLAQTGKISPEAIERIVVAIEEAKERIDFSDTTLRAVTTEAIRQATNATETLAKIAEQTGISFEIIDGKDEAKYALIATQNRLALLGERSKRFMIADIGGGSTELIFYYDQEHISKSFPIGIVTLTQRYYGIGEIRDALPEEMREMRRFVQEVYQQYGKVERFVAMAGTPTTVASMKLGMRYSTYDAQKIQGTILSRQDLHEQLQRLLNMEDRERTEMVGVGREDLIASGILIYDEIYDMSGFDYSLVIDDGVREGVAYASCS
jgi:exopolyphosphatase/guanosine-5'-triphosphate,3'-diphosphate pyrophosphatase